MSMTKCYRRELAHFWKVRLDPSSAFMRWVFIQISHKCLCLCIEFENSNISKN